MTRISLNVIVYNEEARLEECLADARPWVDEIVVVDQMSTDRTPEIAEQLADVHVLDVHHGHAEPSRELAASRSTGDWILILDADERMSDQLKAELRELVEGTADGYWIRKVNYVGGVDTGTIDHYRLVRTSRVRFDPGPHGGAQALSDNVETLDWIGIVHEKTVEEQIYDDARYERIALEDVSPTSHKRNWLSHNLTLREQRAGRRRTDLERLVPADAARVLVVGDVRIERSGVVTRADGAVDAAVVALPDGDPLGALQAVARQVRTGGTVVGTATASRNRRHLEASIAGIVGDAPESAPARGGTTRQALLDTMASAGLDARWTGLVRDGWLDPLALRPDGSGSVVESDEFLLRAVPAAVAEELTAEEIVFAAVVRNGAAAVSCSVIVAGVTGAEPQRFADALAATSPEADHEVVVAGADDGESVAARWNAGARAAGGELLVFVTADATPRAGWLDALIAVHRSRPDAGATGSKVVAWDGTIWHAGLVLGPDRIPYRLYEGEPEHAPHVNRPRLVPAVAADGMAVTRERFVEVGGFDETLAEDLTDADLCLRLRTRGLPIAYAPAAVLTSPHRAEPGTRDDFHRTAKEFTARWSAHRVRSDAVVCGADGTDAGVEWNRSWRLPRPTSSASEPGDLPAVAWTSHFLERGGYTEEAIAAVEALDDAGLRVVASPVALDGRSSAMPAQQAARLAAFLQRDLPEDFVHVAHIGANRFKRHPAAMRNIGRTMFETDRLPADWRDRCNLMDEVWVPSDHNLRTFARAGVEVSKLHKIPETFDAALFQPDVEPLPVEGANGFVFLSMFSWLARKGWDVLLRAWCAEFDRHDDVTLVLKTDVDHAPGVDTRREVDAHLRRLLGRDPKKGPRVVVLDRPLASTEMPRLYRASDAFVLPTRGEGWGRPLMEAMAMGVPAIATRWSGHLEFMDDDNSYLVDYELGPAPKDSWFAGHRWAEPSVKSLRRAMRRVYEDRSEAAAIGQRGRSDVLERCSPELLADAVRDRLEAIDRHPIHVSLASAARLDQPSGPTAVHRRKRSGRLTACVVVADEDAVPSVEQCLASVGGVADSEVVVEAGARGDMGAVRNEALDQASGGWVLMLDATQTLDPASVDVVAELVDRNRFVGYTARERRQVGLDGAVSAVAARTVCLFPRRPDLRYVGRVGEQLVGRQSELRFRVTPSSIVVHQHRRGDDLDPVALARRQLPVLEQTRRDEPDEPFHRYNLGVALDRLGLHAEAERELRTAIDLAPPHAVWSAPAHAGLSRAVREQQRSEEAVALAKQATKLDPDWAQGWALLGTTLADAGRSKAALRAYTRALDCLDETALAANDPDDVAVAVRAGMGRIHLARGEYGEAMSVLRGAIALHPSSARLRVEIAQAHAAMGQTSAALGQLERAAELERGAPDAFIGISDFFTRRAEEALLRGLAGNPESGALLERIERLRAARAVF